MRRGLPSFVLRGGVFAAVALLFALCVAWSIAFIPRAEDVDSGSYRLMACGEPACVKGCPNRAIVYEEREADA